MQTISVRYRPNLPQIVLVTALVFGLCAAVMVVSHRLAFETEPTEVVRTIYLLLAFALGASVSTVLFLKDREKLHWSLSETELVGGMEHTVRIPISSIIAISEGVPAKAKLVERNPWLRSGIVLKTGDNKILALNLAVQEEGVSLMKALLERCSTVLSTTPEFTDKELAILHDLKWNRVIDIPTGKPV